MQLATPAATVVQVDKLPHGLGLQASATHPPVAVVATKSAVLSHKGYKKRKKKEKKEANKIKKRGKETQKGSTRIQ